MSYSVSVITGLLQFTPIPRTQGTLQEKVYLILSTFQISFPNIFNYGIIWYMYKYERIADYEKNIFNPCEGQSNMKCWYILPPVSPTEENKKLYSLLLSRPPITNAKLKTRKNPHSRQKQVDSCRSILFSIHFS